MWNKKREQLRSAWTHMMHQVFKMMHNGWTIDQKREKQTKGAFGQPRGANVGRAIMKGQY